MDFTNILANTNFWCFVCSFIKINTSKNKCKFRIEKISNTRNIEAAEKQRESSEIKLKEYDDIVYKSKLKAKKIFKEAREKVLKDINFKKADLEKQIDEEIKKAEKEIELLKKNAPEKINKIAIETSSELVRKLIGADVNNSSISAIVDDLSKRNGDKYYDS